MNAKEYGVVLAFFTAFDMSAQTAMAIEFWAPGVDPITQDPTWTKTNPAVTVPNVPFYTSGITLPAYQYAQYISIAGDFDLAGKWSARVKYDVASPAQQLISDIGTFLVGP